MKHKLTSANIELSLLNYLDWRRDMIVSNVSWGMLKYEADIVVLTRSGYATEIEIKISKQDIIRDKNKEHDHDDWHFKYLYFAVPEPLKDFAMENIPERAGLYTVKDKRIVEAGALTGKVCKVRAAEIAPDFRKWKDREILYLGKLASMRVPALKEKVLSLQKHLDYFHKGE